MWSSQHLLILYKIWDSDDFQEALYIQVWQSLPSPRYARREAVVQASEDSEPTTAVSRCITLTTLSDLTLITIKTLMTGRPVWQYPFPAQVCNRGRGTGKRGQQRQAGNSTTLCQHQTSCFLFTFGSLSISRFRCSANIRLWRYPQLTWQSLS